MKKIKFFLDTEFGRKTIKAASLAHAIELANVHVLTVTSRQSIGLTKHYGGKILSPCIDPYAVANAISRMF